MARSNSSGALKFVGAGAAAIVGGVAIGYLFGGARTPHPTEQITPQPAPAVTAPARSAPPPDTKLHAGSGNYTAPGAPDITIHEESAPTLRRVNRTAPTPPADTEASQEASPAKPTLDHALDTNTPDTSTNGDATNGDATNATPNLTPGASPDNSDTPPAPPKDNTPPNKPAPADPDFEHVVKPKDTESGQEGAPKAQYRVQTGAFTDEGSARSIADQLRGAGYTASTRSEMEGDHIVYKVQAGAYRSKNGANKAAEHLQKRGFSAYVSPIAP